MRLSTIKLSGFKSFVDPTTLHLPGNMTGIVGPNGCGKSNIIDAVRWVMGESTASRLRGDSLTDVIFSGSSARKPVSQAMVELIFDNSDGTIGGEFASFADISVKRTVSRDAISTYYLNGTRCRRRDVTDLFLGTGLGPRSYSIIEQGMISQLIEARPEELRVFLEEAAGISKYKERRRETETRIRHTRENLDRLKDLREEVGKQIEHLRRQARQAEQYQQLQADHRERQSQLHALDYRRFDAELVALRDALVHDETRLQATIASQRQAETQIELARVQHGEASEHLNSVQGAVYRVGSEIARIEQQIQHQHELRQRLKQARAEAQASLAGIESHVDADNEQLAHVRSAIADAEPSLQRLADDDASHRSALQEAERALTDWQSRWNAHAGEQSEAARAAEVERTRVDYLDRQILDAGRRRDSLQEERSTLDFAALEHALQATSNEHETQRAQLDTLTTQAETRKHDVATLQSQEREQQTDLAELRKQLQSARGRLASLEALQHAALGQESGAGRDWLASHGFAEVARVGEVLDVDPGWEKAVENVLGRLLEAATTTEIDTRLSELSNLHEGHVALVDAASDGFDPPAGSLAEKVRGPTAIRRLLARVACADSLQQGQARMATLDSGHAVVTRDGDWLGAGWVRVLRSGEAQQGALSREREIQTLRSGIAQLGQREIEVVQALDGLRAQLRDAEQLRENTQRELYLGHRGVAELAGQVQSQRGRVESAQARVRQIDEELAQLIQTLASTTADVRDARGRQEQAVARMAELENQRQQLDAGRRELDVAHVSARSAASDAHDAAHRTALGLESQRARVIALSQSLERMQVQREQLQQRLTELAAQLDDDGAPKATLDAERETQLQQRVIVERDLSAARSALDGIDQELRTFEQQRQQSDQQALLQRESIARRRLDEQSLRLHAEQHAEAITGAGLEVQAVIAALPHDAEVEAWRKKLGDIEARMHRLEPVNLAAIQEYGEQSERKQYLDAQNDDLSQALDTLENAIRKIDRETRGRFKDTFDRVNAGVQELYPRLFGGGHAYLELTGDDLLDTGVTIMARPPGKRVSSISLLSGGEKALTAVALVFAIFRLNPAPFCLLDEVDAPLDEANVERFCNMVAEMAQQVQFLFVTHNKGTMQAAHQLSGVTMREPGVSRLVSVDLAEATRLAGAA
ncbi:MAG: chromosome segregation protein SMC [Lysobacteraceae bacterium]